MRQNEWIERKSVKIIEDIFLDNDLQYQLNTNDKTEHIDGYVYLENKMKDLFGIDMGRVEIQVKGRTNSTRVILKKSFLEYCKTSVNPVVIILVNFYSDRTLRGIYYKYVDSILCEKSERNNTIILNDEDIVPSVNIMFWLNETLNTHWSSILRRISNKHNQILNKKMYGFANSIIRSVNGFIYTKLNKFMDTYFKDVSRFAIVYCSDGYNGITYAIVPIYRETRCIDIIEIKDFTDFYDLKISRTTSTGIAFTVSYINKLTVKLLKETISLLIDSRMFCKHNKDMALRSLIYHFNTLLAIESEKLSQDKNSSCTPKYSDTLKNVILSGNQHIKINDASLIVDLNIKSIQSKLIDDLNLFQEKANHTFISECNDNIYSVEVINGMYKLKFLKQSKFFLLRELLDIVSEEHLLDLTECLKINGYFSSLDEADHYVKLHYDCICHFCNKYLSMQSYEYRWNTFLNGRFSKNASLTKEIYYADKWNHIKDTSIQENDSMLNWNKGLKSVESKVFPSSIHTKIDHEPLVREIYEEIQDLLFSEIDQTYFPEV